MSRELAARIIGFVEDAVASAGMEMLLERQCENDGREIVKGFRVVPDGGMVPFAEVSVFGGGNRVSFTVGPTYASPDGDSHGYYLPRPGAVPTPEEYEYAGLRKWEDSPESLAEAVVASLRKRAVSAGIPIPEP